MSTIKTESGSAHNIKVQGYDLKYVCNDFQTTHAVESEKGGERMYEGIGCRGKKDKIQRKQYMKPESQWGHDMLQYVNLMVDASIILMVEQPLCSLVDAL